MLSILISTYNYDVCKLVSVLHKQLTKEGIQFELICLEDGSDKLYIEKNASIKTLSSTSQVISKTNNGRTKTRQLLADNAKYDWLLFLDADVLPKKDNFIYNYIRIIGKNHDAVYGGYAYHNTPPEKEHELRWKYGKIYEEVSSSSRNETPYRVIISGNFLIKKSMFNTIHSKMPNKGYGYDNYIAALFKDLKADVFHIDNEVYHLGIEKSHVYLKKVESSIDTLLSLHKNHKINHTHDNRLLLFFLKYKRYKVNYLFSFIFKRFNTFLKNNLLGHHPNPKLLQLYKISYMCYKDIKS